MPKRRHSTNTRLPKILAVAGLALLIIAVLAFKDKPQTAVVNSSAGELAETQLDRALQAGQPTLAFFHSNNCQQCIDMMQIVAQVYPEFAASVALVDINVYDEANKALLERVGLQYIPTLIFYDQTGKEQVSVGVMETERLRQTLAALVGDD